MFLLLGIHGKARAGKDTVAKYLVESHGFMRNAFADPLKRAAQHMFCLTDAQTWDDDLKEVVIPFWGKSPRQLFQLLGTEGGRQVFGEDLWLKRWRYHYDQYSPHVNYVTPDVRFDNEADLIRALGGTVIHVVSARGLTGLAENTKTHASEAGVKFHESDVILPNNGTFKTLYDGIDAVIQELRPHSMPAVRHV